VPPGDASTLHRDGFVAINDVEKVEHLLRAAIDKAAAPERAP